MRQAQRRPSMVKHTEQAWQAGRDEIEVIYDGPSEALWRAALPQLETDLEKALYLVLEAHGISPEDGPFELSLLATHDAQIATLNASFREKPAPTNVLSWPSHDLAPQAPGARPLPLPVGDAPFGVSLGDIALAYETCTSEAEEQGKRLADHVFHLMIHSLLHLLGYDHITEEDAQLMEGLEITLLEKAGIANPYRDM